MACKNFPISIAARAAAPFDVYATGRTNTKNPGPNAPAIFRSLGRASYQSSPARDCGLVALDRDASVDIGCSTFQPFNPSR